MVLLPIAGKIQHVVVHQSQNRADFAAAAWGQLGLYYSRRPVGKGPSTKGEFIAIQGFHVPPPKAMALFERIKAGVAPEDIIRDLDLKETPLSEVHRELEDVRIAHGWRSENRLIP